MQARSVVQRSTPQGPMPEELAGRRAPPPRALSWDWTGVEVLLLLLLPHHGATELIGDVEAGPRAAGPLDATGRVIGRPRSAQGFTTGVGEKKVG